MMLRQIEEQDLGMLLEHRNDYATRKWLGDSRLLCIDDQYQWYKNPAATGFWIAEENGEAIGLVRVRPKDSVESEVGCDVFRHLRGKGYGHKVFDQAIRKATDRGARWLSLWVFVENEAAVRIYEEAGFHFEEDCAAQVYMREGKPCHYAKMMRK